MQRQLRASKQLSNTDNGCSLSRRVKTSKWYLWRIDTDTDLSFGLSPYFLKTRHRSCTHIPYASIRPIYTVPVGHSTNPITLYCERRFTYNYVKRYLPNRKFTSKSTWSINKIPEFSLGSKWLENTVLNDCTTYTEQ